MLRKKFKDREEFGNVTSDLVSSLNPLGGAIMKASLESDKDIFTQKGIVSSKIIKLPIETSYEIGLPKWETVKDCIDTKSYENLENDLGLADVV